MGLVARKIEEAGISTLVISNIAEFSASVGTPRIASIHFPGSQPMGPAEDRVTQKAVLIAALKAFETIREPGEVVALPFEWPRGVSKALKPRALPPIAKLMVKKPWLLPRFINGDIPD